MYSFFTLYMRVFLLVICILFIDTQVINAQTADSLSSQTNPLSGLRLAGPGDIEPGTPLMLDPMSTPIYDEQFQKVKPGDFMNIMMSGEFIPEPYVDDNKMVRAFVLRKATPEEKEMMSNMQKVPMDQDQSELVGTQALDFELVDLTGKKYKLSELKGKVVVLNFWFVECKPCIMEIPELNELTEEFKGKEVVFLAIALNEKKQLKKFIKTTLFKYNIVSNGQSSSDSYGVKGFPTNVIIDQNGLIQYVSTGVGPNNKANLLQEINALLTN
jgi:peroxiredoxin